MPSQLGQLQLQPLAASVAASNAVSAPSDGSTPSALQQQQPQSNARDTVNAASSALGAAASLTSLSTGRQESASRQDRDSSSTSKQDQYSKLRSSSSSSSHPSSSAVDEHSSPSSGSTLSSAQREHLISRVRMAYDLVKNKRESSLQTTSSTSSSSPRTSTVNQAATAASPDETTLGRKRSRDESSEPDSEASWDPASSDEENLRALGMKLYEIFAVGSLSPSGGSILPGSSNSDSSPGSKQSSNAGDSMDEGENDGKITSKKSDDKDPGNASDMPPPKKKQKKAESFVPLRELGMPIQLCNMVSSLLSGGQSSFSESEGGTSDSAAGERPTPLKIEEELHKMISDPDSYLFSSTSSTSNGSNGTGSTGTSGSTGGSGSMNGSGSSNGSLDASGSVDGDGSDSTGEDS